MLIHIHQTSFSIADFKGVLEYLKKTFLEKKAGIHLFPELFLTGYPLQDLVFQRTFIDHYLNLIDQINTFSKNLPDNSFTFLLGGLRYEMEGNLPRKIENVIYELAPGKELKVIYVKQLLPNYDIYDEKKYFTPGSENGVWEFQGQKFGLLICEDMWASNVHPKDPIYHLKLCIEEKKHQLSAIINLSASPFHVGKDLRRKNRAQEISKVLDIPFIYVNKVGGEDEILFDGGSFVFDQDKCLLELPKFKSSIDHIEITPKKICKQLELNPKTENTWENLFSPRVENHKLKALSEEELGEVLESLKFGLQEYATKNGFKKFLVALSGGIDSSLVLVLTYLSLKEGQELEAIYMPSLFSSPLSSKLAEEQAKKLGIKLHHLPIKFLHSTVRNTFKDCMGSPLEGLADENIQSRLRGALLYARSNQSGAMVINTSNKSELAVGYSTQYGDSVGAISLLGDLYKTEVYQLAEYINKKFKNLIPEEIIHRPPTAELRENQTDAQSLPPYETLDLILEEILSYREPLNCLTQMGINENDVKKVYSLYQKTEYKRFQFCPIIKVHSKSFGFGYRIPISKTLMD